MKPRLFNTLITAFIAIFALLVLFASINKSIPDVDSGVFLYIGRSINHGLIPYKQIWDHKPPLIFFINALGLSLANNQLWGVWLLEGLFFTASALLSYNLLQKYFGKLPALITTILWVVTASRLLEGGNLTEEYALLFQFFGLLIFSKILDRERTIYKILFGVCFTGTFLLRQNLIAIFIVAGLALIHSPILAKRWEQLLKDLGLYLLGVLIILLPVSFYFIFNHAVLDLLDQAFHFNAIYSGEVSNSITERIIDTFLNGLKYLGNSLLSALVIFGWFGVYYSINSKPSIKSTLLYLAFLSLPLEILFSSVSGRIYFHYFLSWIPAMSILSAFYLSQLVELTKSKQPTKIIGGILILAIAAFSAVTVLKITLTSSKLFLTYRFQPSPIEEYVKSQTNPSDFVLAWGDYAAINFVADRFSPTRYVYQQPLYVPAYQSDKRINEFFQDVKTRPPKLIIESNYGSNYFPSLNCQGKFEVNKRLDYDYRVSLGMVKVRDYICDHYQTTGVVDNRWLIHVLKP